MDLENKDNKYSESSSSKLRDEIFSESIKSIQTFEKYIGNLDNALKSVITGYDTLEDTINVLKQENNILKSNVQEIEESRSNMNKKIEDYNKIRFDKIFFHILSTFSNLYNEILDGKDLSVVQNNADALLEDLCEILKQYDFSIEYHKRNEKPDGRLVSSSIIKTGYKNLDGKIAKSDFGYGISDNIIKIFKQEKLEIYEYEPKLDPNVHPVEIVIHDTVGVKKISKYSGEVFELPTFEIIGGDLEQIGWSFENDGPVIKDTQIVLQNNFDLYPVYLPKKHMLKVWYISEDFKEEHLPEEYYVRTGEKVQINFKEMEGLSPKIEKFEDTMPDHDISIEVEYSIKNKIKFDDNIFEIKSFDREIISEKSFSDENLDVYLKTSDGDKLKIFSILSARSSHNEILFEKRNDDIFRISVSFEGIFMSGSRGCPSRIGNAQISYLKNIQTKQYDFSISESNRNNMFYLDYSRSLRKYKIEFYMPHKKIRREYYHYGETPTIPELRPYMDKSDYVRLNWKEEVSPVVCNRSYSFVEERSNLDDEVLKLISSGVGSSKEMHKIMGIAEKIIKDALVRLENGNKISKNKEEYSIVN